MSVKYRYWIVNAELQELIKSVPKTSEVWRDRSCNWYVVRYLRPVTERAIKKLPIKKYYLWVGDPQSLRDRTKYDKLKELPQNQRRFFMTFAPVYYYF